MNWPWLRIRRSGLLHVAFNPEDGKAFETICYLLTDVGYPVNMDVDHNISCSFYARDTDGYLIELTTDVASHEWEQNPQAFKYDKQLSFLNLRDSMDL